MKNIKKNNANSFLVKYGLLIFMLLVILVFTITQPRFISINNLMDIITSASIMAIAGLGATIVMSTGEIDYACGAELTCSSVILAVLLSKAWFKSYFAACVIVLAAMICIGLFNAFLHVKIGIPAFIATMGTSLLVTGFNKMITNSGRVKSPNWPEIFSFLGQKYLFNVIPMPVIDLFVVSLIVWFYIEKTKFGRELYAVGSNKNACKYVGINEKKVKVQAFIISAILCGFAGIVMVSMLNSADPYMGDSTLLNSLTMLMLGACFYRIGQFNIPGTIIGALLVSILTNGMTMAGATTYVKYGVQGIVLVIAIAGVTITRKIIYKK